MKLNFMSISLFLFALILLNSCGDSGTEPETNEYEAYFPSTVGSYWIYENYKSDKDMGEVELVSRDSVYVAKDTIVGSKKCKMLITINTTDNKVKDTTYQRLSGSKFYIYNAEGEDEIPINGWIQMVDLSKSSGTVLDSNITVVFNGISINAKLTVDYLKDNTPRTFKIDTTNYNVEAYDYNMTMNGTAMGFPITVTSNNSMYYVKNIGDVQEFVNSGYNAMGQTSKEYSLKKLITYKIK